MAVFEKEIPTKVILDDTDPLSISILSTQTVDNHTEYVIRVQRSSSERKWTISRRYNDFVRLHSHLSVSKLLLQLPPKKLLGNMDREFVIQRQAALQEYLESVLSSSLCNSLHVKKFLDPENYCQPFNEQALQHVSMALRSDLRFEVIKPLDEVGWRLRKHYFSVKRCSEGSSKGEQLILSWVPHGPDQHVDHRQLSKIVNSLSNLQHPHIEPPLLISIMEAGAVVVCRLAAEGSLKDILYSTKPCDSWLTKFGHADKAKPFPQRDIARVGAQILDTLLALAERGLHYGHLHPGNILVGEGGEVRLLDIENCLLGLPCIYRPHMVQLRKVHTPESVDAYCLGHTLYEMALGRVLTTPTCDLMPSDCSPLLWSLLESVLSTEACRKGLPSLAQLRSHSFFAGIPRANSSVMSLQLSSQLRQALATSYSKTEARLKEDQKKLRQLKRQARVQQHLILEEQQQQQLRKSSRPPRAPKSSTVSAAQAVNGKSPERSDSPASTNTSGGTLTPPPGPVPAVVTDGARSGDGEGLSALLGSICNFDKSSLRNMGGAR